MMDTPPSQPHLAAKELDDSSSNGKEPVGKITGSDADMEVGTGLFHNMAKMPWPYMVLLPIVFFFLIGFGWSKDDDDIIEKKVNNIWVPQSGGYAKDVEYAEEVRGSNSLSSSAFAAMAVSRDGGNLFTKSRLEEIRARMEKTENTTVEYNGHTYTWDDVCASNSLGKGTAYKFPCARLSPMDLFQEARWFFDETDRMTWYDKVIREGVVEPRIPRFGSMMAFCYTMQNPSCNHTVNLRMSPDYAEYHGYSRSYAQPMLLFADIGNMEHNDMCRMCIEESYTGSMQTLLVGTKGAFGLLAGLLSTAFNQTLTANPDAAAPVDSIIKMTGHLAQSIELEDIEDFYMYYVTRDLYAQLGAGPILTSYKSFDPFIDICASVPVPGLECPVKSENLTLEDAQAMLLAHADHAFSSINSAGVPFPFWGETIDEDGDAEMGYLFYGSSPVSGSGVDMSAEFQSMFEYLDLENFETGDWEPKFNMAPNPLDSTADPNWVNMVEKDPIYAWFTASLKPAEHVCGNDAIKGLPFDVPDVDVDAVMAAVSPQWCTKYDVPNKDVDSKVPAAYTQQHFARMWYDMLIVSPSFLGVSRGEDDPYTYTLGQGCGYTLGGERDPYSTKNQTEYILGNASREVYYVDEGESVGAIDRHVIIGDNSPAIGEYSFANPLTHVGVVQSLYATLLAEDIPERVKSCNRPNGPVYISEEDGEEILYKFKEALEDAWSEGWDDDDNGEVQFVGFTDDTSVIGSTGRLLFEITLDNGKLTAISICFIAFFSVLFLFSMDAVESKVLVTLAGVSLVVIAYFAALGLAILFGIKINVTIAWTLPFIILGLGVDDMYIVLEALKQQKGYKLGNFLKAMGEVVVPVTMTSLVNASMFAILNVSDVPAVYLTAQVAFICVVCLYLVIIFCYPAYCYLDFQRQAQGRWDVLFWRKEERDPAEESDHTDIRQVVLYDKLYKPLVLGSSKTRLLTHSIIGIVAVVVFACGIWGITDRTFGLGLEDFFPDWHPTSVWATKRTEALASWSIGMNWGEINYTDPDTQMRMIGQFEGIVRTPHVAQIDTKFLWMADLLIWTSRHCGDNSGQSSANTKCGRDQEFEEGSFCAGTWTENKFGLRKKIFQDPKGSCEPYEGGICRPGTEMHKLDLMEMNITEEEAANKTYCPVIDSWSEDKWQFCMLQWRNVTGYSGGRFVLNNITGSPIGCEEHNNDEQLQWPIRYSAGPSMISYGLYSHELTLDLIRETREVCDDDEMLHCWMTGIPYDYWSQYEEIFPVLVELSGYSTLVGFAIAFLFLFVKFTQENLHSQSKVFGGSIVGALLIAATILASLVSVVGLSILAGVNLTGFSNMAFVLSVGFAVEYSVHIVSRWLRADLSHESSLDRVKYTMSFLMLPTFMSFVSSTIGVICLAFTDFDFNIIYFFRPLIVVMFVTYFYGCWWLPTILCYLDFDLLQLGKPIQSELSDARDQRGGANNLVDLKEEAAGMDERQEEEA